MRLKNSSPQRFFQRQFFHKGRVFFDGTQRQSK
nr:hypothetical protein DLTAUQXX_DLTAUQXX_CDS_0006 [uncultured phage]CAI9750036.1 hypothetical protein LUIDIZRK_LUIDIZRK_CDS_0006 [uncultured phage]